MKTHRLILKGAIHLLPTHLQARYAEQWQADLEGAAELEISKWSITAGAIIASASLAGNFEFHRIDRAQTVADRARFTLAFGLAFLTLLGFAIIWGGSTVAPLSQNVTPLELTLNFLLRGFEVVALLFLTATFLSFGWLISTFVPSRFRSFTTVIIGLFLLALYGLTTFVPALIIPSAPLLFLALPLALSFILWVWAKLSTSGSTAGDVVHSSPSSLRASRRFGLVFCLLALAIFPFYAFVVYPPTSKGEYTVASYWELVSHHSLTWWSTGNTNLAVLALTACIVMFLGILYFATRWVKTSQTVLAIFGFIGLSAAFYYLAQLSMGLHRPAVHALAYEPIHTLVLAIIFAFYGICIASAVALAIAPCTRNYDFEPEHSPSLEPAL